MKKMLLVVAVLMFLAVGNAYAGPVIDGLLLDVNEWNGSQVFGIDTHETDISDSWNIKSIYAKVISGDGWYFRMDTFAKPTFAGGPGSADEAIFDFFLDVNGDNAWDYRVNLNGKNYGGDQKVTLWNTSSEILGSGATNGLKDIIEMYVPNSMLSTSYFGNTGLGVYSKLDGSGREPDDFMPDKGYAKTPEPASMALVGMGLVGFVGSLFRRKFNA